MAFPFFALLVPFITIIFYQLIFVIFDIIMGKLEKALAYYHNLYFFSKQNNNTNIIHGQLCVQYQILITDLKKELNYLLLIFKIQI